MGGNIVISEKVGGMLVIPINMGGKLDICRTFYYTENYTEK